MGRLDNKTAVITGAAQGIGALMAKAMADEGANVLVPMCRTPVPL